MAVIGPALALLGPRLAAAMNPAFRRILIETAETLAIALAGGLTFTLLGLPAGLVSGSVVADTIYTYTGDAFVAAWVLGPLSVGVYTPADRITGSFTVGDGFIPGRLAIGAAFTYGPFGPDRAVVDGVLDYAFTDGHQTLTKRNSTATIVLEIPADPAAWAARAGYRRGGQHRFTAVAVAPCGRTE